jgi:uncharacterized protein (DUF2132 family)
VTGEAAPSDPVPAASVPANSVPANSAAPAGKPAQPHNPLHGLTLEAIVTALADYYGWEGLGQQVPVRCFTVDPSVGSSLKFLRKTPWARDKVESLYLFMLREQKREQKLEQDRAQPPG